MGPPQKTGQRQAMRGQVKMGSLWDGLADTDRRVKLKTVSNCRDLGGIRTTEGAVIRRKYLYRSAAMRNVSKGDKEFLKDSCRLTEVIDLRTLRELEQMPDDLIEGIKYTPIPVFDDMRTGISHEKEAEILRGEGGIPPLEGMYRGIAMQKESRQRLGAAPTAIMSHDFGDGSILWHCTEGKDRCGVLSALVLLALSVDRKTVMEDYMLTNEVNVPKSEMLYRHLIAEGRSMEVAVSVREAYQAKESYLQAFLDPMDEEYAEPVDFIREALGVPGELILRFKGTVLA